jgi:PAS domain S-box
MQPQKLSLWRILVGPLLTILTIVVVQFFAQQNVSIPPVALLILSMVIASYFGNVFSTAFSCVAAWGYLVFASITPYSLMYNPSESKIRVLVWSLAVPAIGLLVSILKNRSEAPLKNELEALQKSQKDLLESEERFRMIVSSAHDALIVIDAQSRIQEWNPQAEMTFGWKRSEVLNHSLAETIIPMQYRQSHSQGISHYMKSGEGPVLNKRFEITALKKNGVVIPVELTIYPFKQGGKTFFGSFLHDISEKKRTERNQKAQVELTRIITETTSLTNAIPQITQALGAGMDFAAAELWLLNPDHMLTCRSVWPTGDEELEPLQKSSLHTPMSPHHALLNGNLDTFDCLWIPELSVDARHDRKEAAQRAGMHAYVSCRIYDGSDTYGLMTFYHTSVLPRDPHSLQMLSEAGKKIGLFVRRRIAEEEISKLNRSLEIKVEQRTQDLAKANEHLSREIEEKRTLYEQAQVANRLKDEFLATVSHELRTPLNVIMGYSEMLVHEELSKQETQEYISTIHRNAKVQSQIVNDILDISRIVTGKLRLNIDDVDIASVVTAAIKSVEHSALNKHITITTHLDAESSSVAGDFGRLQQVLWNLISNSIKFTPRYGQIDISTSIIESQVEISVKDSGLGIDPEFLPYVFERFRQEDATTTRRYGGLGLGLSIVKNIVELHGGSVIARSNGKNQGSEFLVTLPVHAVKIRPTLPPDIDFESSHKVLEGVRALVVEDQVDALNLIAKVLSRAGAEVFTASNATDALQIVIRQKPNLLISDIGMPEQDGYYLIQMVRKLPAEHGGNIPAIALTAYAHLEDQERAKREGFQVHVAKPVEGSKLISIVADLMGKPGAAPEAKI